MEKQRRIIYMDVRGLFAVCGLWIGAGPIVYCAENDAAEKEFGTEKAKPIASGFFFWNYQYVEAPYIIERIGLSIFINKMLMWKAAKWPQPDATVKEDPGDPPEGCAPWNDKTDYFSRKSRYLFGKHDENEAFRLMIETFHKCAAIEEVKILNPRLVKVSGENGNKHEIISLSGTHRQVRSKEQILDQSSCQMQMYERALRSGMLLWHGDNLPEVGMPKREANKVIDVLLSSIPEDEKIKRAKDEGVFLIPEMGRLLAECRPNEQLVKRFAKLKKGEPDDIPSETPATPHAKPIPFEGPANAPPASSAAANHTALYIMLGAICALLALLLVHVVLRRKSRA